MIMEGKITYIITYQRIALHLAAASVGVLHGGRSGLAAMGFRICAARCRPTAGGTNPESHSSEDGVTATAAAVAFNYAEFITLILLSRGDCGTRLLGPRVDLDF